MATRVLDVLHVRLRAVREYIGAEEANLASLERRFTDGGMESLARSFAHELELQRERVATMRGHAEQQQEPLLRLAEAERDVIEATLATLDEQVAALERNLASQRELAANLLAAMRSEHIVSAWELAGRRQAVLEELAQAATIDPVEIARRLDGAATVEHPWDAVDGAASSIVLPATSAQTAADEAIA